jgi:type III secretion protein SpaR/YscT/HrcT
MGDPILERLGLSLALDPTRLIVLGALTAARVLPIFTIAPFFGGKVVPQTVRVAISLSFAALVFPFVDAAAPADLSAIGAVTLAALALKELAIGVVLAFLASLPFFAAEAAGRMVDTARGANMAEVMVPQTGTQSSPLGDFSLQLAVIVFFAVDGHLLFLRALAASYEAIPPLGFPPAAALHGASELAVDATGRMLLAALGLAAPVLAALFLTDLALGLVNRVSPQIQVYFLGMPAKAILGIIVLLLATGGLVSALSHESRTGIADVLRAIQLFRK